MEPKWAIVAFVVLPLVMMLVALLVAQHHMNKSSNKLIQALQDTIHRLVNREPVTYQEVGKKPEKIIEEVYSAWGNVTVDREVEDRG